MVRFKNRWILFEILYDHSIPPIISTTVPQQVAALSTGTVNTLIRESIRENFGEWGMGCVVSSLNMKYFSPYTNIGIVRVARDHYRILWGALTFIKEIRGTPCVVRALHLSGTIIKAQNAAIEYDRDQILNLKRQAELNGDKDFNAEELLQESRQEIMAIEN
ncbi:hypothetical protein BC938DRAFT_478229 [Jimgerdemannia flammicorona]|uniref:Ribonuclease P/MRP protein subunit POP5 n=1 Tax=Jimgerdemannia flammicorona TaxID=994334 RepID=A0A433QN72_9FUNG|nr:hypothetical protein BC938DRAFT_478229 [Jimgerdemannia flammicorona]